MKRQPPSAMPSGNNIPKFPARKSRDATMAKCTDSNYRRGKYFSLTQKESGKVVLFDQHYSTTPARFPSTRPKSPQEVGP